MLEISDFCADGRIKSLLLNSACSQVSHAFGSAISPGGATSLRNRTFRNVWLNICIPLISPLQAALEPGAQTGNRFTPWEVLL